mgnify:CR=1 FL=1
MSRRISQAGIDLIKSFEGCRLKAYKPVATETYYTIGWGHYGPDVKADMTITQVQANSMLVADLAKYEAYVSNSSYVPVIDKLTQNQFDALVSFCYNCGAGNLQMLCKSRTVDQISDNITKYDKSSGTVLAGLVRRRKAEQDLYNKTNESKGEPVETVTKVKVKVNGVNIADGVIQDGVTIVSVRALAEALGASVVFDADSDTVNITSKR